MSDPHRTGTPGGHSPRRRDAAAWAAHRLRLAGVEDGARDARLLLEAALEAGPDALLREPTEVVDAMAMDRFAAMLERRLRREPVSRILGRRAFYGRDFRVTPETLDPRPETETLIDAVLGIVEARDWRRRPLGILDVGTGTGCILTTLLAELPAATGVGRDISAAAVDVAAANGRLHAVVGRARWQHGDGLEGIEETFDFVVSNPPYVAHGELAALQPEVREFDPRLALDGGEDGLAFYRYIATNVGRVIEAGFLVLEIGRGRADDVVALLRAGLGGRVVGIRRHRDLGGVSRCLVAEVRR